MDYCSWANILLEFAARGTRFQLRFPSSPKSAEKRGFAMLSNECPSAGARFGKFFATVGFVFALAASRAFGATIPYYAYTQLQLLLEGGNGSSQIYYDTAPHAQIDNPFGFDGMNSWSLFAYNDGQATFGGAGLNAAVIANNATGQATASAGFVDYFTVTVPGVSVGTPAYMLAEVSTGILPGPLYVAPFYPISEGYVEASVTGSFSVQVGSFRYDWSFMNSVNALDQLTTRGSNLSGTELLPVQIIIGEPTLLSMGIVVDAAVTGTGEAIIIGNDPTYWGGIKSVTVGGVEEPFSITSASGTNYAASFVPTTVPEPSTIALLGFGLAGLGFSRRRRAT